jgi:hypothetical protein
LLLAIAFVFLVKPKRESGLSSTNIAIGAIVCLSKR